MEAYPAVAYLAFGLRGRGDYDWGVGMEESPPVGSRVKPQ